MSQYKWTNDKYEFQTGWDRPLKYFFLVIDHLDQEKREDIPIFSNLDLPSGPSMSIEEIKETCQHFGSELPGEVETSMVKDKEVKG